MYDVLFVAKYVVDYYNEKAFVITHLKLQKMLYLIQANFLVDKGEPCFPDDFEAWDYGPVIPKVYEKYKRYRNVHISSMDSPDTKGFQGDDAIRINGILNLFAHHTGPELVRMTHRQAPWRNAYSRFSNNVITQESIKEYYLQRMRK